MADFPLIRDVLRIDQNVQNFLDNFDGDGPVFLLARRVEFGIAVLRVTKRPLVVIADVYDGTNGLIDSAGEMKHGPPAVPGAKGADGARATFKTFAGVTRPTTPGGNGLRGGNGESGYPGEAVTLLCREGVNVRIWTHGTSGAPGGDGGRGGEGGDGWEGRQDANGQIDGAYDGTRGGYSGPGGAGGAGGDGGALQVVSTTPLTGASSLSSEGGRGAAGGRGFPFGRDGNLCPEPACPTDGSGDPCRGPDGAAGADGANPVPVVEVVPEAEYVQRVNDLLNSDQYRDFRNFWAPFRARMGEYHFRRFNPDAGDDDVTGLMAAMEFRRALEMQENPETRRLQGLLATGRNALGLARELDVVPDFKTYLAAYTASAQLVAGMFTQGLIETLAAEQLAAMGTLAQAQAQIAEDAAKTVDADLVAAKRDQATATDDTKYLQEQLDKTTADIQAASAVMQTESFGIGTIAEIGAAVAAVAGAIPTGGASLVALVPAVISFASTVVDQGTPIVNQVLAGEKVDTDKVAEAYKKVDGDVKAVIASGKAVANFVTVVKKIADGTTPDNAKSAELVKRGAELTHQLLVAKNTVESAAQQVAALEARSGRMQGLVQLTKTGAAGIENEAVAVRGLGLGAIQAGLAHVDTLATLAFLAQRSLEIYTLTNPAQPALDAGWVHPELERAYTDGMPGATTALVQAYQQSWARLLNPLDMQNAYVAQMLRGADTDIVRLQFTDAGLLKGLAGAGLPFRLELGQLTVGSREAKIRGVAVALVGASTPSGLVSCELEHGSRYEQLGPDGTPVVQILEPHYVTVTAPVTPLVQGGVRFGQDAPVDAPQVLSYWGRGVAGDWVLRLPAAQPNGEMLKLDGLTMVQVWIGYQFVHAG